MADPQQPPRTQARGPRLPALERLAPIPDASRIAQLIDRRSKPGEVVLELLARGGWVSRVAVDRLRRSFAIETTAITRLVAEVVLRPPDLRHLDAAVSGIAVDAQGMEGGLRSRIEASYASRCPSCGSSVVVAEFIWESDASDPSRRSFRCPRCRDARSENRPLPVDADDLYRARAVDALAARAELRLRFPVPAPGHALPDELVDLYPPRAQVALAAILERIEGEPRAASIQAALRLAVLHMLGSTSRLNGYPGRVAQLRISGGHVRPSTSRQWRERNAWSAFEEGTRLVREFVQALGSGEPRTPARVGPDLRALLDGSANVALRFGAPLGRETFGPPPRAGAAPGARPRVRPGISLVLSEPPVHWSAESLSFAYLASSLAVGPEAAATLPLAALFGTAPRAEWARDAITLQRALHAVAPVLLPDAQTVILLDEAGPEALVACVIGGVGAGLRVDDAALVETPRGLSGHVQFGQPGASAASQRDVAIRSASDPSAPFQISAVEAAITDVAVAVIQLRGEPTRFLRILGEVLLGLDHLGHLRRLVGTPRAAEDVPAGERELGLFGIVSDAHASPAVDDAQDDREASGAGADGMLDEDEEVPLPRQGAALQLGAPDEPGRLSDPVRLTLDIIRRELGRADHPRLAEIDEDLWWLRAERDLAAARPSLSERVEWGIFSLLSTGGGLARASFDERVSRLFRGPETADTELVEACLESYRDPTPSEDGLIRTAESLPRRYAEHGEVVGMLAEFGHRLGMRVWIARHEQRRRYLGGALADLLSEPEQRVYLPLVAPGPQEALEGVDCIWYVRGRGAFLFDVEWQSALDEAITRRGPRIESSDSLVRFLVVADERAPLVRLRLAQSPLIRSRMEQDNWHILKWSNVRRLHDSGRAELSSLGPLLGLDPAVERGEDQMALFTR